MLCFIRDLSRMVVVPFSLPKIGAKSAAECEWFLELSALKKKASASLGWAISIGNTFRSTGVGAINGVLLPKIHPRLVGAEPRMITGYSILLYFVDEVWLTLASSPGL
jgi:hypothetical protein